MRIVAILLLLLMSFSTYAKGPTNPPNVSGRWFYFSIGFKGGAGSAKSVEGTPFTSRDLTVLGVESALSFHLHYLVLGIAGYFANWSERGNSTTDLSGNQMTIGGILGLSLGHVKLIARPNFLSSLTLDNFDKEREVRTYTSPKFPSFSYQLIYEYSSTSYVGIDYTSIIYEQSTSGRDAVDLTFGNVNYSLTSLVWGIYF